MPTRIRHIASGILATTGQDPRVLGNAWEIVDKSAAVPADETPAVTPAETSDAQPADETADDKPADDAADEKPADDEDGATDGDSAADGRGDEPAKGSQSTRKGTRRGTTAKSGKSSTNETA